MKLSNAQASIELLHEFERCFNRVGRPGKDWQRRLKLQLGTNKDPAPPLHNWGKRTFKGLLKRRGAEAPRGSQVCRRTLQPSCLAQASRFGPLSREPRR